MCTRYRHTRPKATAKTHVCSCERESLISRVVTREPLNLCDFVVLVDLIIQGVDKAADPVVWVHTPLHVGGTALIVSAVAARVFRKF